MAHHRAPTVVCLEQEEERAMENGKLYGFMDELYKAGCSAQFIVEQGYVYAVQLQREKHPLHGLGLHHVDEVTSSSMDMAAQWVGAAALGLGIHPVQMDAQRYRCGGTKARR